MGSKADITFMQTDVADLRTAVARQTTAKRRPTYGAFYGFEASVPHQTHMMIEALGSCR